MRVLLAAALLACGVLAWAQGQPDLRTYAPASLPQALAGGPKSRGAIYELEAADQRLRVEATWTGKMRPAGPELVPLVSAWMQRRYQKPDPGPVVDALDLAKFPELEFEAGGERHWLLLGYPALMNMAAVKPGQRKAILLHRIGFAQDRPVAVIYLMATPEQMGAALAAAPAAAAPAPAKPAGPEPPLASARFSRGQVRFVHVGKPYALQASVVKDRPLPSRYEKLRDSQGGTFEAVSLDFGHPGPTGVTISLHARGAGEYAAPEMASLDLNVMLGGVFLHLGGRDFPGCKLKLAQVDVARVKGRIDCPQRPPSGLSDLEFEAAP